MAATAAQILQVRRMTDLVGSADYTDATIKAFIESYPLMDELGSLAYTWDYTSTPPSQLANTAWIPTYDLAAAAADIWQEKASSLAQDYDFNADGGSYTRSQAYQQFMTQARYYRSRRSARTIKQFMTPDPTPDSEEVL